MLTREQVITKLITDPFFIHSSEWEEFTDNEYWKHIERIEYGVPLLDPSKMIEVELNEQEKKNKKE